MRLEKVIYTLIHWIAMFLYQLQIYKIQVAYSSQLLASYILYKYTFQNVHYQTLCPEILKIPNLYPKGTQKPFNLHSSPNCWHDISNTNIHIQLTHTPQIVGSIYPIQIYIFQKCTFPNPVPEGHTETLQLTFIPQLLACYIQTNIYIFN